MTRTTPATPPSTAPGPLREVWSIAWPTVLTMTSYTVMQFVDKLMLGQVGPLEVAAQGNGAIWAMTPIAFAMGVLTVVNTFVSQNLGAGTPERGPAYAWASLWVSILTWAAVLAPLALALPMIFEALHSGAAIVDRAELLRLETDYGRIMLLGGLLVLCGRGMHHFFFGLHRPKVVTFSAICGNVVNVGANYVLIFGENGLPALGLPGIPGVPALGLYGAALGTVLGALVEFVIPMAVFLGPRMNAELRTRASWRPAWGPIRDLLKVGWPASVQFGNEITCWSIFMTALVGVFGEDHMTAGWITLGYMHLSFMPAVGFSVAVTSVVGKYIGAGKPDTAVARARLGLALATGYMTVCAIIFLVFRHELVALFVGGDVTPEQGERIVEIGAKLLICAAVFQTVDAFGILYTGALRGAGDTTWPGLVTLVLSWTVIVGGGWLMIRYAPGLQSVGPWIAAAVYIILYALLMAWRFESGKWRSIRLLRDTGERAAHVAPLGPGPPASDPEGSIRDRAGEIGEEFAGRR